MQAIISAPLLYRIKSWQLIGLGLTGWATLYSIALINWAACSTFVTNTQGGLFAATMTLASFEARRLKKNKVECETGALHWADAVQTFQLNQMLELIQQRNGFAVEPLYSHEKEMGFGVRVVKEGRTFLFETSRWKEATVDLVHAKTTDENRKMAKADRAVIVSTGVPDEDTRLFVKSNPLELLVGEELEQLIKLELPKPEISVAPEGEKLI